MSLQMSAHAQVSSTLTMVHEWEQRRQRKAALDSHRRDWQLLTRVLERCCITAYIMLTLLFAILMLTRRPEPIVINKKLMDELIA